MNYRKQILAGLIALLASFGLAPAQAEEAAAASAAVATPVAETKAEAPVSGAAVDAKKDAAAKTEGESKPENDPQRVVGKPPVFPLQSQSFSSIDDDYKTIGDNIDRKSGLMELDLPAIEDCLVALRASSLEHLKQNTNKEIGFRDMLKTPEKFRGSVVRRAGILESFREASVVPNLSGITTLYRGQLSNCNGEIVSFQSIEPLPEGLKVGQPVQMTGIFLQRYAYLNRQAGDMLTWTPLIFVRQLEPYTEVKALTSGRSTMADVVAGVLFAGISLAIAAFFWMRAKDKASAGNYFTRLKEEREGPQGLFPKPTNNRPKHK